METIFQKILWKLYFGKFDGNYISDNLMETIFRKNFIETILWKIGMDNLMEQLWRASESRYCEAKRSKYDSQLAIPINGTTLWRDTCERTK